VAIVTLVMYNQKKGESMAKTTQEKQAEYRARMKKRGLKEIRSLYIHPDDNKKVREYAQKLLDERKPGRS